jgi:phage baseplate assembly protein W
MPTIRSLQHPLTIRNGGLATSEDFDVLRQSIDSVLSTRLFERVMAVDYGTPSYVFEIVQDPGVICEQIRISLATQIPEVDSFSITGQINEDGVMDVRIEWTADSVPQPPIQYRLAF